MGRGERATPIDVGKRAYRVRIDLTYLGGKVPSDESEAMRRALEGGAAQASLRVVAGLYTVVVVTMTMRAGHPLDAVINASRSVDQALLGTGLFEVFDVTGRVLRVAPLELAGVIDKW